ncbi:monovalent cation/H+ antiporter complex subunit F [Marinactinospora rubrisoli]|uniref:Monovalent cation/H+ antiporter complex subunit F n=1 Tax=Marinactinospora rubrisoli TaxID=2715399 RepID=A0ABW2KBE8_9ACTN
MTAIWIAVEVLLGAAALLSMARLVMGPSILDRALSVDVVLAATIAGVGTFAAFHRDPTLLPVLLVVSLLGFVGSVSVARFVSRRTPEPEPPAEAPHPAAGPGPESGPENERGSGR